MYDFRLPMRNWNYLQRMNRKQYIQILDYLWGIETKIFHQKLDQCLWDFRLPMRNWNEGNLDAHIVPVLDFRLPMRNWNKALECILNNVSVILDYLWGIETCKGMAHVIPFACDFRLPMRNWNNNYAINSNMQLTILDYLWGIETSKLESNSGGHELILDYLWGIETYVGCKSSPTL